jgi:PTS system, glucose subfamily, IIA component
MFNFKSKNAGEIYATQNGMVVSLSEVPDEVFAGKILGDGVAIIPDDDMVLCPVEGTIVDVTETLHAYCIHSKDGLDILVHVGIDTVNLKGEGFESFVKVGDIVKTGDALVKADLRLIREKGYETYTPIIITNMDDIKDIKFNLGKATAGKSCAISYTKK